MARDPLDRNVEKAQRRADGVTIAPAPGSRKPFVALLTAALLAGLAVLVLIWGSKPEAEPPRESAKREPLAPVAAAPEPRAHPVLARVPTQPQPAPAPLPTAEPTPEVATPSEDAAPEEHPTFPIQLVPSGIGLFPPPGSDPVKIGILVPDDFELPEGYLRHYQVTDDGHELPPILMFHPDYEWLDEAGNPVDTGDRIVPPELAPEGMPIETLFVPAPEPE